MAIKIRRPGAHHVFKKTPFRDWLDKQPRKDLTYSENVPDREGMGWKTEDFVRECWKRGADVRLGTANKWSAGSQPRWQASSALKFAFPKIQF